MFFSVDILLFFLYKLRKKIYVPTVSASVHMEVLLRVNNPVTMGAGLYMASNEDPIYTV